jgi:AcrR family transcriptional regulator
VSELNPWSDELTQSEHADNRRKDTRNHLLIAAMRLLAEHGYAGATTGQITKAAGIKQPSFYAHFDSRDACIAESIRNEGRLLAERLAQRRQNLPTVDGTISKDFVQMGFTLLLNYLSVRGDFMRVLNGLLDAQNLAGDAVRDVLTHLRDQLVSDLPRFGVTDLPDLSMRADFLINMIAQAERGVRMQQYELNDVAQYLTQQSFRLFET